MLSKDGEVLTNNHVVAGAGEGASLSVSFNDGTTKKAKVVGTDPLTDIAVIKVEGRQRPDPRGPRESRVSSRSARPWSQSVRRSA